MSEPLEEVVAVLRQAGARFAYLFGSRALGDHRPDSDYDVAAFFGDPAFDPISLTPRLPAQVDLIGLDRAGLELAGRVATTGKLLFEDDPPRRVEWEATTRKIYFDERPRMEQARKDFAEGARLRGRR